MNKRTMSPNDYKDVSNVAAQYIEAIQIGNVDMLADIFHKDAATYGTVNGELMGGPNSNPAVKFIRNCGKSPDIVSHIDVLDMTPTTAVVRMVIENDAIGSDCNTYLTLIKLEKRWTVIAKVFHQFNN